MPHKKGLISMPQGNPINLSLDDFEMLKKMEIGHGTDGTVYRYNKNYLIKIYHTCLEEIKNSVPYNEEDEVKIYDSKTIVRRNMIMPHKTLNMNDDIIKSRTKGEIYTAMERQKNIKRTYLPQNAVYIDNHFAGCLIKVVNGIQLHKLSGLPMNLKLRIVQEIIISVKELIDNYIYHIDLQNSPFSHTVYKKDDEVHRSYGHSHVKIVDFKLTPQIIDLEGKSTIYTYRENEYYKNKSLASLTQLICEYLLCFVYDDFECEEDLQHFLKANHIDKSFHQGIIDGQMSFEEIDDFLKTLKK